MRRFRRTARRCTSRWATTTLRPVSSTPNNGLLVHSQFTGWYSDDLCAADDRCCALQFLRGSVLWRQSDDGTVVLPGDDDHYERGNNDFFDDDERLLSRCGRDGSGYEPGCGDQRWSACSGIDTDRVYRFLSRLPGHPGLPIGNCPLPDATPVMFTTSVAFIGRSAGSHRDCDYGRLSDL